MRTFILISCLALLVALAFSQQVQPGKLEDKRLPLKPVEKPKQELPKQELPVEKEKKIEVRVEQPIVKDQKRPERRGERVFDNSQAQFEGKFGSNADNLPMSSRGWSTFILTPNQAELMHCQSKLSTGQGNEMILHDYSFYDKQSDLYRGFFLIQKNETDLGQCYHISSELNNVQLDDWELSDQTCGANGQGKVYTRRMSYVDAQGQEVSYIMAACRVENKLTSVMSEFLVGDETIGAMEGTFTRHLEKPDLQDSTTRLELNVPFVCFIGEVRPFDIRQLVSSLKGEVQPKINAERQRQ
jgi:hypothetical protein